MKTPDQEDPLNALGKKALRRLARKYKIKHFYRKSPASLRRAIRRLRQRKAPAEQMLTPKQETILTGTSPPSLNARQRAEQRRKQEVQAYEEHRLRYLFTPSLFLHKGTHEEYILEKDDEIDLPDFYREDELVALPIDPYRFYLYWDFAEETLYDIRSWLAEDNAFLLRIHDVSNLLFDGNNAHQSWESRCHPLVREWYLDAPVSGRHLCVELGVLLIDGFRPVLRSNTIYVPPASVSTQVQDTFAFFVPEQLRPQDPLPQELPPPDPAEAVSLPLFAPKPETSAHLFFQEYVPSPAQFHPTPPPQDTWHPQVPLPVQPLSALFPPLARQTVADDPEPVRPSQVSMEAAEPAWLPEPTAHENYSETELQTHLQSAGQEAVREWLGIPHEIRWLSDLPVGMSTLFFEQWVSDPYDRAVMISYAIWPWELTEYLPLGASDWSLRKFLGASLFSWYKPGGSERMRWWQRPAGASERSHWLQPQGASERSWSGAMQPHKGAERSAWTLWPPLASGRGMLG